MKHLKIPLLIMCVGFFYSIPVTAQVGKSQGIVEFNHADEKTLLGLPHMNAAIVKEILDRRPFSSMKDLHALLQGKVAADKLPELYRKAFVHLNLNTATEEEILMIPGLGKKMLHEFLEYRPYKNLAHFHKEIGKYVDEKELARLEQYVFVPIPLNTATDQDILSIPGLGQKMLHEFKEYRPYKSIEQFRREIDKYVNAKEVARLERYVVVQ